MKDYKGNVNMFIRFFNMDIIDMNLRCINKHHSTNSVSSSSTPP